MPSSGLGFADLELAAVVCVRKGFFLLHQQGNHHTAGDNEYLACMRRLTVVIPLKNRLGDKTSVPEIRHGVQSIWPCGSAIR